MSFRTAVAAHDDQPGLLEHVEMAHHAESSHRGKHEAEVAERLAVDTEQLVEERSTARVAEGLEDEVVAFRHLAIM